LAQAVRLAISEHQLDFVRLALGVALLPHHGQQVI